MKKIFISFFLNLLLVLPQLVNAQAKYVFYFIGDGMGINQVNATEMYLAEMEGRIGIEPLIFTQFPVSSFATTYSLTNSVTDSAASGTALATGEKTNNNHIGVDKDKKAIETIAEKAKKAGKNVGIVTSVSIDHATPAAFYAHQPNRNMFYEIATDLPKAGFDFYAGGGFLRPNTTYDKKKAPNIYPIFEKAGYYIAHGYNDYIQNGRNKNKVILMQEEKKDPSSIPYALDKKDGDLSLLQITESAIDFLTRKNDNGFFLMVESGKIDWACHANDGATVITEIIDFNKSIKLAYEFYKKHPDETLIIVTADHETGGISMGTGKYELNLKALGYQKCTQDILSKKLSSLRKSKNNTVSWDEVKELLQNEMGFWKNVPLKESQEAALKEIYQKSFVENKMAFEENLYSKSEPLAAKAKEILNQIALLGWTSGGHSAGVVPVFAIGTNATDFDKKLDNSEIATKIAKIANY